MNSDTVQISIATKTEACILNLDTSYCKNSYPIELEGSPGGGTFSGNAISDNVLYTHQLEAGIYDVWYTYANQFGCIDTAYQAYRINEEPFLSLGNDTTIFKEDTLVLKSNVSASEYLWYDGSTEPECFLSDTDLSLGENIIFLSILDAFGCKDQDTILITLERFEPLASKKVVKHSFELYPNPFSDKLYIKIGRNLQARSIELYSTGGNLVTSCIFTGNHYYSFDEIDSGLYILLIRFSNGIALKKISKI